MKKPEIIDAIRVLVGGKVSGYSHSYEPNFHDGQTPPTKAKVDAKLVELLAEYNATQYQRNRAMAYPAIADQLDEIYHNGIDSWKAVIKVTKDKYPKG